LILDSGRLIAGERQGQRVWDILEGEKASQGQALDKPALLGPVFWLHWSASN